MGDASKARSSDQRSIRLYPEDVQILEEWAAVLSPMMKPDRSALIREVLRRTRHCIADEQARLIDMVGSSGRRRQS